jgi:hypothetical protein
MIIWLIIIAAYLLALAWVWAIVTATSRKDRSISATRPAANGSQREVVVPAGGASWVGPVRVNSDHKTRREIARKIVVQNPRILE